MPEYLSPAMAVCYLCGVIDEATKVQRRIAYYSPAATNKVLAICNALRQRSVNVQVISAGRGGQLGDSERFPVVTRRVESISVNYAAYQPGLLTHLVTSLSLMCLMFRWRRTSRGTACYLIAYNRKIHYLPSLLVARVTGVRCYLDLEDGALVRTGGFIHRFSHLVWKRAFDFICSDGVMLAGSLLTEQAGQPNRLVCHGVAFKRGSVSDVDWDSTPIRILYGGSLLQETGAQLLMDAVSLLENQYPELADKIEIAVTGYGVMSELLRKFAETHGRNWIRYYGMVDRSVYNELLANAHVGLCLKLPSYEMCATTFPSKVVEYASFGKAVLTTRISDVGRLFGDNGIYCLADESPKSLVAAICKLVGNPLQAKAIAMQGQTALLQRAGEEKVANDIVAFLQRARSAS